MLKYCHFSPFRVFCSIRHIFSKGQIKLWGHCVSFFLLSGKMCEKLILLCMESHKIINFNCFSLKKYLHLVRSNKKSLYWKECDHISSLKKEDMFLRSPVQYSPLQRGEVPLYSSLRWFPIIPVK